MPDLAPIPHRCRRGNRCPERERLDDGQVLGGHINAADGLCPSCERHVTAALDALPTDYVELDLALGCGTSLGGQPISGTRELPIPIRTSVEAVQAAILHEAWCWAESVADVMRVTWDTHDTAHSRPGYRVQRATALLSRSVSVLLALRDVVHIGAWDTENCKAVPVDRDGITGGIVLLDLHWRARATLGRTRRVERLRTACFDCDRPALEHPDGADIVTCAACAKWWTWDEYQERSDPLAVEAAA